MEALSDSLQDYKEIVANLAFITTVGQFFSGAFICYDIKKKGSTKGFDIMPFLGGCVVSVLNLQFGFLLQDDIMIKVNLAGLALNIIYLCFFYQYALNKGAVWLKIGSGGAFSAALISYSVYEDPNNVEYRYGMIVTVLLLGLIGAPLLGLVSVFDVTLGPYTDIGCIADYFSTYSLFIFNFNYRSTFLVFCSQLWILIVLICLYVHEIFAANIYDAQYLKKIMSEIIKKKSTAGLPFPIILSGTVVTSLWLLYGIIIKNNFIVFQNVIGFTLCAVQLSLFVVYPSKPARGKQSKSKSKKTN